ncbi:uncharacterized protein V2V93DRAFT_368992 [Kockiozyma suomiensis]|uniref:uncharacterized protein n=1 Tax=Kockiozyma suomiensis TaxID=1337062 RepID=UPI00334347BD
MSSGGRRLLQLRSINPSNLIFQTRQLSLSSTLYSSPTVWEPSDGHPTARKRSTQPPKPKLVIDYEKLRAKLSGIQIDTAQLAAEVDTKKPGTIKARDQDIEGIIDKYGWKLVSSDTPKDRPSAVSSTTEDTGSDVQILEKVFSFKNFEEAFLFMTKLGFYSSLENHHPRIYNFWSKVTIRLGSFNSTENKVFLSIADVKMGLEAEVLALGVRYPQLSESITKNDKNKLKDVLQRDICGPETETK